MCGGTVGVSENVIEASWIALADSLHYKLMKDALAELAVGATGFEQIAKYVLKKNEELYQRLS